MAKVYFLKRRLIKNAMSNKSRKFLIDKHIEISGRSRGWEGEETFLAKIIEDAIDSQIVVFRMMYKGIRIFVNGREIKNV